MDNVAPATTAAIAEVDAAVATSAGAADVGKLLELDANGRINATTQYDLGVTNSVTAAGGSGTAVVGEITIVDTAAGVHTHNLPLTPPTNAQVLVANVGEAANDVTLGRNGETINGVAADVAIEDNQRAWCTYDGTTWDVMILSAWDPASSAEVTAGTSTVKVITPSGLNLSSPTVTNLEIDGSLNHDGANVGFFGTAPVAQAGAFTQTYSATNATHSARTAPAGGAGSGADATTFSGAECDALVADQQNTAQVLNALIDALQAYGLLP